VLKTFGSHIGEFNYCFEGNTALLEAVWVNDVDKAAVLVEAGADVMESNNGGDTVLHISALKGNADMTKVCIFLLAVN